MLNIKSPSQILSEKIASALLLKGIILEDDKNKIQSLLIDGRMKETYWLTAFQNKIASKSKTDEA